MKILVSACLLGKACRYDGASRPCAHIIELKERHTIIPVCPEVMGGLPTPRPASEIQADGRLVNILGKDVTAEYHRGAEAVLALAREHGTTVAILKDKSPAGGKGRIYDGSFTGAELLCECPSVSSRRWHNRQHTPHRCSGSCGSCNVHR